MSGIGPKLINPPEPRVLGRAMGRHLSGPFGKPAQDQQG